ALVAFLPDLRRWQYCWAAATTVLFALGTNFYPFFFPHYVASIACLLLMISVCGLRNLASWNFFLLQSGRLLAQYVLLLCFMSFLFWFGIYASGNDALLPVTSYQSWNFINYRDPEGRVSIEKRLRKSPGKQLVFIRYSPFHRFHEWMHNAADID